MGIIAACIPSMRPLIALLWKGSHRGLTTDSKNAQATNSSASSKMIWPSLGKKDEGDKAGGFIRLEEPAGGRWGHDTNIQGGRERATGTIENDVSLEEMNVQHGEIKVKNEVDVTTHAWTYKDKVF